MAIRTPASRRRALAVLAVLTVAVIQLQLVDAGSASASAACNGAFQGNPQGTLAISASVPSGGTISAGQSITVNTTWNTNDWSGLDAYYNCWELNGSLVDSLEYEEKPPANDGTITQTISVPNSVSNGDQFCVRARLSGQPRQGNTSTQKSNKICWTVGPQQQNPDVILHKSASTNSVNAGQGFNYTLQVENIGNADATNVQITDSIPASLTIGNLPNNCSKNGQTVTCDMGTVAAGANKSVSIPVTTSNGSCPSVDNQGTVSANNEPNANTGNNTSNKVTVDVVCPNPDVTVHKSASAASVNAGGSVTFTLEATNGGGSDATNVQITDTFATGLTIGAVSNGCSVVGQTVTCDLGTLTPGQSKSVTVTVTATAAACPSIQNHASVSASNEPAGSTGNNVSNTVTLNVVCPNPDVAIIKRSDAPDSGVFSGDRFTYTIVVQNVSGSDATGVTVHDSIPAGLDIVDLAPECTANGQDVTCDLGTVAAGQQESVTITVEATDAACPEVTNTATVTAANDSNPNNNTSDPVTDAINCVQPGVAIRITKTNDADGDGRYTDSEEAKRSGLDVPFKVVITNIGEQPIAITDLTDAFSQQTLDLLANKCSSLDGVTLDPGESVKCLFTISNYSPASDAGAKVNTAEVCGEMPTDSTQTDCDNDDSRVRSAEVLGRTITPPPTKTPPSGTAFTGSEGTIWFGLLALALLLFGTGTMYSGYRKRQRYEG
jgi:uncharacterized repeat protein (TIGR01451 family)